MQFYDILMIGVLVGTTAFGAWKGLAWQAASITSLIASYFVALRFRDVVAPFVKAQEPWNRFGAMLIIFAAVSLCIWLVFRYVSDAIDRVKLREFDRQLGALVGLAKGVLFCVVITFFAITLLEAARQPILNSRSGYYIAVLIDRADAVMPHEVHDVLGPYLHRLEDELEPTGAPNEGEHKSDRPAASTATGTNDSTDVTHPRLRALRASMTSGPSEHDTGRYHVLPADQGLREIRRAYERKKGLALGAP